VDAVFITHFHHDHLRDRQCNNDRQALHDGGIAVCPREIYY
jgi:hypothetical protein